MSTKIYWNYLLVLFCVLCLGIIGTLSEEDIDESSKLLVRQKRVINRTPGGDVREHIKNVPYIVIIKIPRASGFCVGAIMTNHIVLTIAKCVEQDVTSYRVYSGKSRSTLNGHYVSHNVTNKRTLLGNYLDRRSDGIALITVTPPFIYSINTGNIGIYGGYIYPGSYGIVSGWGCNPEGHNNPGTAHPEHLRSISVPIISNGACRILYMNNFMITDNDICTLDATGYQYCGVGDEGAPLVIAVNYEKYLVGLFLWNRGISGQSNPDVFVNLQQPTYRTWIAETIHNLEEYLRK